MQLSDRRASTAAAARTVNCGSRRGNQNSWRPARRVLAAGNLHPLTHKPPGRPPDLFWRRSACSMKRRNLGSQLALISYPDRMIWRRRELVHLGARAESGARLDRRLTCSDGQSFSLSLHWWPHCSVSAALPGFRPISPRYCWSWRSCWSSSASFLAAEEASRSRRYPGLLCLPWPRPLTMPVASYEAAGMLLIMHLVANSLASPGS